MTTGILRHEEAEGRKEEEKQGEKSSGEAKGMREGEKREGREAAAASSLFSRLQKGNSGRAAS